MWQRQLNGSQYVPSSTGQVVLFDINCSRPFGFGLVTVAADGTFTTIFTVPSGLVSGDQYPVWVGYPFQYPSDGVATFTYQ